jgi:hypothetical protein
MQYFKYYWASRGTALWAASGGAPFTHDGFLGGIALTPSQRRALLVVIGLSIMAVSYVRSGKPDQVVFLYFGAIAAILGVVLWAFENYLWRLPFLYGRLVSVPNIRGTWTGEGEENVGGVTETLNAGSITIRQTYSFIHVAITWKSGAVSRLRESASFIASGKDTKSLTFTAIYTYTPSKKPEQTRRVTATIDIAEWVSRPRALAITYGTTDGARSGRISCGRT